MRVSQLYHRHSISSLQSERRVGGGSTNHAGCDTAYSTVDFVDCCDAVGVKEFVWDFLLTEDDSCRFGFDADYSDSTCIDGFEGVFLQVNQSFIFFFWGGGRNYYLLGRDGLLGRIL